MMTISCNGVTVELLLSSTDLSLDEPFCMAGVEPYEDVTQADRRHQNIYIRLVTPLSEIKNIQSRMWAEANFNSQGLCGPFATISEAMDMACDPLLGCCHNEAFLK